MWCIFVVGLFCVVVRGGFAMSSTWPDSNTYYDCALNPKNILSQECAIHAAKGLSEGRVDSIIICDARAHSISSMMPSLTINQSTNSLINRIRIPASALGTRLKGNLRRVANGAMNLIPTMLETRRLKSIQRQRGDKALTYSNYKFIEESNDDLPKVLRMAVSLAYFSRKYFVYSNVLRPFFSSDLWAWRNYPSSFNNETKELTTRLVVLENRRKNSLLGTLVAMNRKFIESDYDSETGKYENNENSGNPLVDGQWTSMAPLTEALEHCSNDKHRALSSLRPWFSFPVKAPGKSSDNSSISRIWHQFLRPRSLKLDMKLFPSAVIADWCTCAGLDRYPIYLPIIRNWNVGVVSKYIDKLRKSDEFINSIGVENMTPDEVRAACHERFMTTTAPFADSPEELNRRLKEWVRLARTPLFAPPQRESTDSHHTQIEENEWNKRLIMLGLEVAHDLKLERLKNRQIRFRNRDSMAQLLNSLISTNP